MRLVTIQSSRSWSLFNRVDLPITYTVRQSDTIHDHITAYGWHSCMRWLCSINCSTNESNIISHDRCRSCQQHSITHCPSYMDWLLGTFTALPSHPTHFKLAHRSPIRQSRRDDDDMVQSTQSIMCWCINAASLCYSIPRGRCVRSLGFKVK